MRLLATSCVSMLFTPAAAAARSGSPSQSLRHMRSAPGMAHCQPVLARKCKSRLESSRVGSRGDEVGILARQGADVESVVRVVGDGGEKSSSRGWRGGSSSGSRSQISASSSPSLSLSIIHARVSHPAKATLNVRVSTYTSLSRPRPQPHAQTDGRGIGQPGVSGVVLTTKRTSKLQDFPFTMFCY